MKHAPKNKWNKLARRHQRIRAKLTGTKDRPRLVVYRSLRYIYGQIIDDSQGQTLAACSDKQLTGQIKATEVDGLRGRAVAAYVVGQRLAELAKNIGVQQVVFDRAGYKFHGRVKALAEGARNGGLDF